MSNHLLGTLEVIGSAKVSAVPDNVSLSFTIAVMKTKLRESMVAQAEAVKEFMELLISNGVDPKNIKTSNYNQSKLTNYNRENNEHEFKGWQTTQNLIVSLKNTDLAGKLIDLVASKEVQSSGLSFSASNAAKLQEDAYELAIADALAKAKTRARALGINIGPVVSCQEQQGGRGGPIYAPEGAMMMASPAAAPELPAGELDFSASVVVYFAIALN